MLPSSPTSCDDSDEKDVAENRRSPSLKGPVNNM